ncbi:hypothetical protein ACFSKW_28405 [Nonomuraea mangrovi]|uniref:Uncharacterized protein n=2 Tax=Streptosporangiaceae TaxID=2004 RepID=A0ABW4T2F9_9ACTN
MDWVGAPDALVGGGLSVRLYRFSCAFRMKRLTVERRGHIARCFLAGFGGVHALLGVRGAFALGIDLLARGDQVGLGAGEQERGGLGLALAAINSNRAWAACCWACSARRSAASARARAWVAACSADSSAACRACSRWSAEAAATATSRRAASSTARVSANSARVSASTIARVSRAGRWQPPRAR